ncbi:acetylxylan esterase [Thiothrix nivea]|uniref:Acetyl xylan esterase n=1 Tax=Thiothrix nivea (strain ATCC 35100 / DSM 5205 / JP2) TaxID=870187 RepID=A0A656HBJ6_THINJ|nr:acetylxylan esterase [Thiothrix nivea]EIJ33693.1 Acetyl xylan esterase [Thiothrix nivea DSM 5205]
MPSRFAHSFAFDPGYGYSLADLLAVDAPAMPADFAAFWQSRYERTLLVHPRPSIKHTGTAHNGFEVYDLSYFSTDHSIIGGWVLVPQSQPVTCGLVFGHGYGGCDEPDYRLCPSGAALLFPCFRGLSRSQQASVSSNPSYHVLHDIDKSEQYIIGGCVEDLWLAVSALQLLFPAVRGHIGYSGISFGGGIGALALPWDARIQRAHLNVPTFGNHPLRLQLPTVGSGAAVQRYQQQHGNVMDTLQYYDAASAAGFIRQPLHVAAALFDPTVAPPGQFAIYNALPESKSLFVLEAGHFNYPRQAEQERELLAELETFFAGL